MRAAAVVRRQAQLCPCTERTRFKVRRRRGAQVLDRHRIFNRGDILAFFGCSLRTQIHMTIEGCRILSRPLYLRWHQSTRHVNSVKLASCHARVADAIYGCVRMLLCQISVLRVSVQNHWKSL